MNDELVDSVMNDRIKHVCFLPVRLHARDRDEGR
jgi:hypothetical protein